ncbi:uncharacterized protein [Triticum aestivum]|uniref:uncharacterized protein isoform X2 n=1 Tax=Triticum aestivum TaxID=4565 RepID=UPI001D02AF3B|nr:uncharacterized protein LOC123154879 isoform X2 [Triticum aestivum]
MREAVKERFSQQVFGIQILCPVHDKHLRKRRTGNMEKDAVLVCMVLGFLGSVAVTLGFIAKNYSSKYNGTNCVYRSPSATGLGILGVFLVFINQVILATYASSWCLCLFCCCPCWTKCRRLAPTSSKWNPVYSSDADLTS